jgi:hypothetical protein
MDASFSLLQCDRFHLFDGWFLVGIGDSTSWARWPPLPSRNASMYQVRIDTASGAWAASGWRGDERTIKAIRWRRGDERSGRAVS